MIKIRSLEIELDPDMDSKKYSRLADAVMEEINKASPPFSPQEYEDTTTILEALSNVVLRNQGIKQGLLMARIIDTEDGPLTEKTRYNLASQAPEIYANQIAGGENHFIANGKAIGFEHGIMQNHFPIIIARRS